MNKIIIVVLLIFILAFVGYFYILRPIVTEEDLTEIATHREPLQIPLIDHSNFHINRKDLEVVITPVAKYEISAIILSKKKYATNWASIISPFDLALGWADVSKPENYNHIKFKQILRWYQYTYNSQCAIDHHYISQHSSNHHIIPANDNVKNAIQAAKKREKITLEGYLVNVSGKYKNGKVSWRTSQTRTDTGNGSCEIMYVTSVKLGTDIYK